MKNVCNDVLNTGQCMKGKDCTICNEEEIKFNVEAKVFIPKSKQLKEEQLTFNLNAKEYTPKEPENEEVEDENEEEELDMIMKDIVNNDVMEELGDDNDSDDEKWYPKYKDCECCKGFVFKCKGDACVNMGTCYCKVKEECDDEDI
jgi:hypothetical protein